MTTTRRILVTWGAALLLSCSGKSDTTPPSSGAPDPAPTPSGPSEPAEESEPAEASEPAKAPEKEPEPAKQNLADTLRAQGNATKFLEACEKAGVMEYLTGTESEVTLIVPTDDAFAKSKVAASKLARKEEAAKLMKYHMVPENMDLNRVMMHRTLPTLAGPEIPVQVIEGTKLYFDKANLVSGNIEATNGTIHLIDQVLVPGKK
ncbi:MAG: fasciclin domain-containing protein [Nannocystaceae bacterium]